jgi:hypothetical protein
MSGNSADTATASPFKPAARTIVPKKLDRSLILRLKGVTATGRYDRSGKIIPLDMPCHLHKSASQAGGGFKIPIFTNPPA